MNKNEALQRCMKICSLKEYAPSEIKDKLLNWEITPEDADMIIEELIKENFIDTSRFARFYVNDKIKFNKWGKTKTSMMLKQKGIPKEIINEALENFDPDEYFNLVKAEISKKNKTIKSPDDYIRKGKIIQFALSRGFEHDVIRQALENLKINNLDSDF
jgi:regulatory protein